jgi:hypothetical protein
MKKSYTQVFLLCFLCLPFLNPVLHAQCGTFFDGFESGVLGPQWTFGTGAYTRNITTTNPAQGLYALEHGSTTSGSFHQGTNAVFTSSQPAYMSFRVRTNTTTGANGYVVVGNSNIVSDNGILFFYFNGASQLRFFNQAGYNHNILPNTWYHVEARDVDWVARNMDIWINGVLILNNWAFRSTTATNIDRVHLFSLVASAPMYDNIQIGIAGPSITNVVVAAPTCPGLSGGSIDLTTTSLNGNMTYSWSSGDTTQDISNLAAGTYVVSVTDALGCVTTDSITVTDPTAIAPAVNITTINCPLASTGAIDLTTAGGNPGYSYQWSNGAITEDLIGLATGDYTVTITDANGCTFIDTLNVPGPSPFDPQAVVTSPTCFLGNDGQVTTNMTGGSPNYSYNWSTNDTSASITGLTSGNYFLTVTDINGCVYTDTFSLANGAALVGNGVIINLSCNGDQTGAIDLTPANGTPSYSFSWSTGSIQEDLTNLNAGTYLVTITDANGCIGTETHVVTEPTAVAASGVVTNATTLPSPGAINLTPSGGTPGYTFAWSNSATTEDLSNLAPGNYSVTVTDANGCTNFQAFFVDLVLDATQALAAQVRAWPNPFGTSVQLDIQGIGNTPVEASIQDLAGRVLWQQTLAGDGQLEVKIEAPAGVYLLALQQGEARNTVKLIKR